MANLKEQLLSISQQIHSASFKCSDAKEDEVTVTVHYKHLKGSHKKSVSSCKAIDQMPVIFALCACDEHGDPIFSIEELDAIKDLPNNIVVGVANLALNGSAKKP